MSNPISQLQEYTQKVKVPAPIYTFKAYKDRHPFEYECQCEVTLLDKAYCVKSTSKQKAKTQVAQLVLDALTGSEHNNSTILTSNNLSNSSQLDNKHDQIEITQSVGEPTEKLLYDWHNALMEYAVKTGKSYQISYQRYGSDVMAIGTFEGQTYQIRSNNKKNARLLVARKFYNDFGLNYVARLDSSVIAKTLADLIEAESKVTNQEIQMKGQLVGDQLDVVTSVKLTEAQEKNIAQKIQSTFEGVQIQFHSNASLYLPSKHKPNTQSQNTSDNLKSDITRFNQNYVAAEIENLVPASFHIRKISWYVESRMVLIHIEAENIKGSIKADIEQFKQAVSENFDLLVLINQERRSQLALDALKALAIDGYVGLTAVKSIRVGNTFNNLNNPDPVITTEGRIDHRDQHSFTIDNETSIDLDDAFAVKLKDDGMELYIHIADVSALLSEGSKADINALKQGFTYYGLTKQLPMLPEQMMYQASLLPMKDRLSWTVKMNINNDAKVTDYRIYRSIIRSKFRLTPKQVKQAIDDQADVISKILKKMTEISEKLKQYRMDQGGLSNFNEENIGYQLVQEYMLLANRCVAEFCLERKLPIPYRHHAFPSDSEAFRKAFNTAKLDKQDELIQFMGKASYSVTKTNHDALSFSAYCHFTSPIRRYADLALQRQLTKLFNNEKFSPVKDMEKITDQINQASKKADQQHGKMVYLEVLKKQFDQAKKPMTATVIDIQDELLILKSDNKRCSFPLEINIKEHPELKTYQIGDQLKVNMIENFNIKNESFLFKPSAKISKNKNTNSTL